VVNTTTGYKVWLEYNGQPLLGRGRYRLLQLIRQTSSLKKSAEKLGISYKTAYNYINRIEKRLGRKIIETYKGGKDYGGGARLNSLGLELMKKYEVADAGFARKGD